MYSVTLLLKDLHKQTTFMRSLKRDSIVTWFINMLENKTPIDWCLV